MTLEALIAENDQLRAENTVLQKRVAQLEKELADLKGQLEEIRRASKRQAAPFAKGAPKARPKRPGRKRGHAAAHRPVPTPAEIQRTLDAPLPPTCPACGGSLAEDEITVQYQVEIPPVIPITTQFNVHVGHCAHCHQRVQGQHPEQTSSALGAANLSLGPRALALAAEAKHELGVPYGKIQRFFEVAFGLGVGRATFARTDQRLADVYLITYGQLILSLRQSEVVWADETGWRRGGHSAWLWVFTTEAITVYVIDPSRAHDIPAAVLGPDFDGVLVTDCLRTYDALPYDQQKCLQHFIRRSHEIWEAKSGWAVAFSQQVVNLLRGAIHLQHRYQAGQLTPAGYARACGRLEAAFDRLLAKHLTDPDNCRLAASLQKHRPQLFRFLYTEGVSPTNAPAEQEIRPAVAIRKTSACNRSEMGAYAHEVLASIIRTCRKQGQSFIELTCDRLLHPTAPLPAWLADLLSTASNVPESAPAPP